VHTPITTRDSGLLVLLLKKPLDGFGGFLQSGAHHTTTGGIVAKTKRISIGFQPSTYAALERLAVATGQSISGIVSGFMDEGVPEFEQIIKAVQMAKKRPVAALDLLQESLAKAQHLASQGQLDLVETRKRHNKRRAKK
jgi:hypothetical protein